APRRRPSHGEDCCGSCLRATPLASGAHRRGCPRPAESRWGGCGSRRASDFLRFGNCRQGEVELAALAGRGLDPDASAVVLDYLLGNGETNTGAGILVALVQA